MRLSAVLVKIPVLGVVQNLRKETVANTEESLQNAVRNREIRMRLFVHENGVQFKNLKNRLKFIPIILKMSYRYCKQISNTEVLSVSNRQFLLGHPVQLVKDGSKPFPESPRDVSYFNSRGELFFHGTDIAVRDVPHSERRSMSENDFTHAVLNVNILLFRKNERYENTVIHRKSLL